jgi:tRNA pseudouridine38-40 synthase
MVRNLAGVLVAVGSGRCVPVWAAAVLAARDRTAAAVTAPPQGLCLVGVTYPGRYGLQAWSAQVSAGERLC